LIKKQTILAILVYRLVLQTVLANVQFLAL
jgi:hypothetical protein